jgi:hypothetical protein
LNFKPTLLLEPKEWHVNSGSYFVDMQVSHEPATEPYVEDARKAEIAKQEALTERIRMEGEIKKFTPEEQISVPLPP